MGRMTCSFRHPDGRCGTPTFSEESPKFKPAGPARAPAAGLPALTPRQPTPPQRPLGDGNDQLHQVERQVFGAHPKGEVCRQRGVVRLRVARRRAERVVEGVSRVLDEPAQSRALPLVVGVERVQRVRDEPQVVGGAPGYDHPPRAPDGVRPRSRGPRTLRTRARGRAASTTRIAPGRDPPRPGVAAGRRRRGHLRQRGGRGRGALPTRGGRSRARQRRLRPKRRPDEREPHRLALRPDSSPAPAP